MALSNAEKQRRYRARQKSAKDEVRTEVPALVTFYDYIYSNEYRGQAFETAFDLLDFRHLGAIEDWARSDDAVKRCIGVVGNEFDGGIMALMTLAALVNEYKVSQIDAKIMEIENSDVSTTALKEAAEKYLAVLREQRKQFQRKDRYQFLPMQVEGE